MAHPRSEAGGLAPAGTLPGPATSQFLRLGSCLSLYSLDARGFLTAEGFSNIRLQVGDANNLMRNSNPDAEKGAEERKLEVMLPEGSRLPERASDFKRCVFRLMPAQSYEAISAYRDALARVGEDGHDSSQLERLRLSAQIETRQNRDTVLKLLGTDVMYGQVVQLLHVRSGKYLSARPRQLSETEKECTLLELDTDGDKFCHFNLLPRYKHRREGDPVHMMELVVLRSTVLSMYIHVSSGTSWGGMREANLSHERTRWLMKLYVDVDDDFAEGVLQAGGYVRLFHVDQEANLVHRIGSNPPVSLVPVEGGESDTPSEDGPSASSPAYLANGVWQIEHLEQSKGGVVVWGAVVRFRHVPTGEYLCVTTLNAAASVDGGASNVSLPSAAISVASNDTHLLHNSRSAAGLLLQRPPTSRAPTLTPDATRLTCSARPGAGEADFTLHPPVGNERGPIPLNVSGLCIRHEGTGFWLRRGALVKSKVQSLVVNVEGEGDDDDDDLRVGASAIIDEGVEETKASPRSSTLDEPVSAIAAEGPPTTATTQLRWAGRSSGRQTLAPVNLDLKELVRSDSPAVDASPRAKPPGYVTSSSSPSSRSGARSARKRKKKSTSMLKLASPLIQRRKRTSTMSMPKTPGTVPTSYFVDSDGSSTSDDEQLIPHTGFSSRQILEGDEAADGDDSSADGARVGEGEGEGSAGAAAGIASAHSLGGASTSRKRSGTIGQVEIVPSKGGDPPASPSMKPGVTVPKLKASRPKGLTDRPSSFRSLNQALNASQMEAGLETGQATFRRWDDEQETHRTEELEDEVKETPDAPKKGVFHLATKEHKDVDDVFRLVGVASDEVVDIMSVVSALTSLQGWVKIIVSGRRISSQQEHFVTRVLGELIMFCTHSTRTTEGSFVGHPLDIQGVPIPDKQRLIIEQGILPMLVSMLTCPFKPWGGRYGLEQVVAENALVRRIQSKRSMLVSRSSWDQGVERQWSQGESKGTPNSRSKRRNAAVAFGDSQEPDGQVLAVYRVCTLVYKLIRHIADNNRDNEVVVAQHIEVFIAQLGFDLSAEETLTNLLTNNLRLLEQMHVEQIQVFLQFIRDQGKRPEYLNFLAALCSCLGRGVPANQELICDLIFGDGDGMLRDATSLSSQNLDRTQSFLISSSQAKIGYNDAEDVIGGADVILPTREPALPKSRLRAAGEGVGVQESKSASTTLNLQVFIGKLPSLVEFVRSHKAAWTADQAGTSQQVRREYVDVVNQLLEEDANGEWVNVLDLFMRAESFNPAVTGPGGARLSRQSSAQSRSPSHVGGGPDYDRLAAYFLAMLRLYTEMCLDRNYVCVAVVQRMFSREALFLCLTSDSLHASVRAACCRLLLTAYVDVKPLSEAVVAERPRLWSALGDKPTLPVPRFFASLEESDKEFFNSLGTFATDFLCKLNGRLVADADDHNQLVLSVLTITHKLVLFGFFQIEAIARMSKALMLLLDGRNDEATLVGIISRGQSMVVEASRRKRSLSTRSNVMVLNTSRQRAFLGSSSRPSLGETPRANKSSRRRTAAEEQEAAEATQAQEDRYSGFTSSEVMMDCKVMIARILLHVCKLRVHLQMASALRVFAAKSDAFREPEQEEQGRRGPWFARGMSRSVIPAGSAGSMLHLPLHRKSPSSKAAKKVRAAMSKVKQKLLDQDAPGQALSLHKMAGNSVVGALLDLMMYKHEKLASLALALLTQHFQSFKTVCSTLAEVQLIVSPGTVSVFNSLRVIVPELRQLSDASEIWMNMDNATHKGSARECRHMLGLITDMMFAGYGMQLDAAAGVSVRNRRLARLAEAGAKGLAGSSKRKGKQMDARLDKVYGQRWRAPKHLRDHVDLERQLLMKNMQVPALVLQLIRDGTTLWKQRELAGHLTPRFVRGVRKVFNACYRFLIVFCRRNNENQHAVATGPNLAVFGAHLRVHLCSPHIFTALLSNNISLCRNVAPPILRLCVDLIKDLGQIPALLGPLFAAVTCHGFLPDNQRQVVRMLMEHMAETMPLYYDRPGGVQQLLGMCTPDKLRRLEDHLFYDGTFRLSLCTQYSHVAANGGPEAVEAPPAVVAATGPSMRESAGISAAPSEQPDDSHEASQPSQLFMAEDAFSAGLSSADLKVDALWYHVRLMQLLTACCYGQNYEVEAKCQGLMKLMDVVRVLSMGDSLPLPIRLVLHEFFLEAWLYTERLPRQLLQHRSLITMFRIQADLLVPMFKSSGVSAVQEIKAHPEWPDTVKWRVRHAFHLQYTFGAFLPSLLLCLEMWQEDEADGGESSGTTTQRDHLSLAHMLDNVAMTLTTLLSETVGMSRISEMLTHSELEQLSNFAALIAEVPLLSQTLPVLVDLREMVADSQDLGDDKFTPDNVRLVKTASVGRMQHPYVRVLRAQSSAGSPLASSRTSRVSVRDDAKLQRFNTFLDMVEASPAWVKARKHDFQSFVRAIVHMREEVQKGAPPKNALKRMATRHQSRHNVLSGSAGHSHVAGWHSSTFTFDDLIGRMIDYATDIGTEDEAGLRLILAVVRDLLDKADANNIRRALHDAQCQLESLGAVKMLYAQLCQPGRRYNDPVIRDLVTTAVSLLTGGNSAVQRAFYELMINNSNDFLVNLVFQITAGTNAVKSQPESHVEAHLDRDAGAQEEEGGNKLLNNLGNLKKSLNRTFVGAAVSDAPGSNRALQSTTGDAPPPHLGRNGDEDMLPESTSSNAVSRRSKSRQAGSTGRASITSQESHKIESRGAAEVANSHADPEDVDHLTELFRFIQVLCEGHYSPIQNFLRDRRQGSLSHMPGSAVEHNVVALTCSTLEDLHLRFSDELVDLTLQVLDTVTELVQGPCLLNQVAIVNLKFVDVVGKFLNTSIDTYSSMGVSPPKAKLLQFKCVVAILSLFEGRNDNKVHRRVASLIEARVLKSMLTRVYADLVHWHDREYEEAAFLQDFMSETERTSKSEFEGDDEHLEYLKHHAMLETGFEVYILMRRLADHIPSFQSRIPPRETDPVVITTTKALSRSVRVTYQEALKFFSKYCKRIEILHDDTLRAFYFPLPPMCQHLTTRTLDYVKWHVNRESSHKKVTDFFGQHESLLEEMRHQQWLQQYLQRTRLNKINAGGDSWKTISFTLAWVINLLILTCYQERIGVGAPVCGSELLEYEVGLDIKIVIQILGALQTFTSSFIVIFFLLNHGPLLWKRGYREARKELTKSKAAPTPHRSTSQMGPETPEADGVFRKETIKDKPLGIDMSADDTEVAHEHDDDDAPKLSLLGAVNGQAVAHKGSGVNPFIILFTVASLLVNAEFMYHIAYVVMTILGNAVHPFFFSFHLVDLVVRYETLKSVLQAVTTQIKPLGLTAALFMVTEFLFTLFSFMYLKEHYEIGECKTLFRCFFTTFDLGFKHDGGLGGGLVKQPSQLQGVTWGLRMLFDNLFNILLLTVLLNIVFGIIIDNFAYLRERDKVKEEDMKNVCFICSIDRSEFDKHSALGFEHHIKEEHHWWNYIYLFAHLKFKPRTELTGIEEYLLKKINDDDLSWVPVHRAMALSNDKGQDEVAVQLRSLEQEMANLRSDMTMQLTAAQQAHTTGPIANLQSEVELIKTTLQHLQVDTASELEKITTILKSVYKKARKASQVGTGAFTVGTTGAQVSSPPQPSP